MQEAGGRLPPLPDPGGGGGGSPAQLNLSPRYRAKLAELEANRERVDAALRDLGARLPPPPPPGEPDSPHQRQERAAEPAEERAEGAGAAAAAAGAEEDFALKYLERPYTAEKTWVTGGGSADPAAAAEVSGSARRRRSVVAAAEEPAHSGRRLVQRWLRWLLRLCPRAPERPRARLCRPGRLERLLAWPRRLMETAKHLMPVHLTEPADRDRQTGEELCQPDHGGMQLNGADGGAGTGAAEERAGRSDVGPVGDDDRRDVISDGVSEPEEDRVESRHPVSAPAITDEHSSSGHQPTPGSVTGDQIKDALDAALDDFTAEPPHSSDIGSVSEEMSYSVPAGSLSAVRRAAEDDRSTASLSVSPPEMGSPSAETVADSDGPAESRAAAGDSRVSVEQASGARVAGTLPGNAPRTRHAQSRGCFEAGWLAELRSGETPVCRARPLGMDALLWRGTHAGDAAGGVESSLPPHWVTEDGSGCDEDGLEDGLYVDVENIPFSVVSSGVGSPVPQLTAGPEQLAQGELSDVLDLSVDELIPVGEPSELLPGDLYDFDGSYVDGVELVSEDESALEMLELGSAVGLDSVLFEEPVHIVSVVDEMIAEVPSDHGGPTVAIETDGGEGSQLSDSVAVQLTAALDALVAMATETQAHPEAEDAAEEGLFEELWMEVDDMREQIRLGNTEDLPARLAAWTEEMEFVREWAGMASFEEQAPLETTNIHTGDYAGENGSVEDAVDDVEFIIDVGRMLGPGGRHIPYFDIVYEEEQKQRLSRESLPSDVKTGNQWVDDRDHPAGSTDSAADSSAEIHGRHIEQTRPESEDGPHLKLYQRMSEHQGAWPGSGDLPPHLPTEGNRRTARPLRWWSRPTEPAWRLATPLASAREPATPLASAREPTVTAAPSRRAVQARCTLGGLCATSGPPKAPPGRPPASRPRPAPPPTGSRLRCPSA